MPMQTRNPRSVVAADSVTQLDETARGACVVSGSHAGIYATYLAAQAQVAAILLHDAGIGRDRAGIAGLSWLDGMSIPAAAVSHLTARIGDASDIRRRGRLGSVNMAAAALGLRTGMSANEALDLLNLAPRNGYAVPKRIEARRVLASGSVSIMGLDSAALIRADDTDAIVITGSHGGLPGGKADHALKHRARAAAFNDAGVGIDQAGIARLAALEDMGVAAWCYAHESACIGDATSAWVHGIVSHCNATASSMGVAPGDTVRRAAALCTMPLVPDSKA